MLLINVLLFHPNLLFTVYTAIIEMDPVTISLEPAGSMSSLSGEGAAGTLEQKGLLYLSLAFALYRFLQNTTLAAQGS